MTEFRIRSPYPPHECLLRLEAGSRWTPSIMPDWTDYEVILRKRAENRIVLRLGMIPVKTRLGTWWRRGSLTIFTGRLLPDGPGTIVVGRIGVPVWLMTVLLLWIAPLLLLPAMSGLDAAAGVASHGALHPDAQRTLALIGSGAVAALWLARHWRRQSRDDRRRLEDYLCRNVMPNAPSPCDAAVVSPSA